MRIGRLAIPALILLSACSSDVPAESTPEGTTDLASASEQFPGVDIEGVAACVRENASETELTLLGAGGDAANQVTADILRRASTQQCIADNNVRIPEPNA